MRKCLTEEFASIRVFHLRGDIRKNMLSGGRAGEGENVFGQGSMTGVAITVFVRNPDAAEQGRILFRDIGDYLDRKEKLDIIKRFGSTRGIHEVRGGGLDLDHPGRARRLAGPARPKLRGTSEDRGQERQGPKTFFFGQLFCSASSPRPRRMVRQFFPNRALDNEYRSQRFLFYNSEVIRWLAAKESTL